MHCKKKDKDVCTYLLCQITAAECVHHTRKDWTLKDRWYSIIDENSSNSNSTYQIHTDTHLQSFSNKLVLKVKRKPRGYLQGQFKCWTLKVTLNSLSSFLWTHQTDLGWCLAVWLWVQRSQTFSLQKVVTDVYHSVKQLWGCANASDKYALLLLHFLIMYHSPTLHGNVCRCSMCLDELYLQVKLWTDTGINKHSMINTGEMRLWQKHWACTSHCTDRLHECWTEGSVVATMTE